MFQITIVSDRSAFKRTEFQEFVKANGINHVVTAPYQPQSNGLAKPMELRGGKRNIVTLELNNYLITRTYKKCMYVGFSSVEV